MKHLKISTHHLLCIVLCVLQLFVYGCKKTQQPTPIKPVPVVTFTNPIMEGADPWVIKKDGFYYFCMAGTGGIYVAKSEKLSKPGTPYLVWRPQAGLWNSTNVWAPELHYINGKWYIYYTAGQSGPPYLYQRAGVLEAVGQDPLGAYVERGNLYTGDNIADTTSRRWAIDLTVFTINNQLYAAWSGWENNATTDRTQQHLYMARMSNPWTIATNRVKISSPTEAWEVGTELSLNEAPEFLRRNGKIFIIYSTRESWLKDYRLGQLTLRDSLNPLDAANWQKKGPVFQGSDNVFGVGHCAFTTSPDGKEDWILYHAKKSVIPGWERHIHMQPFGWNADGSPNFGIPVAAGQPIPVPSGEK